MTYTNIPNLLLPEDIPSDANDITLGLESGTPYEKSIGMVLPEYNMVPDVPEGIIKSKS
jgi:hypothetical protein